MRTVRFHVARYRVPPHAFGDARSRAEWCARDHQVLEAAARGFNRARSPARRRAWLAEISKAASAWEADGATTLRPYDGPLPDRVELVLA